MGNLKSKLLNWLDEWRDRSLFMQSVRYWQKAGALMPFSAGAEERAMRLKLEEFRNYASKRYLEDPSLLREDIKQEWLDQVVKPMARIECCLDRAKALKAAVQVIGDEMFVGLAAKQRKAYIDKSIAEAKAMAPVMWKVQRQRAMKI